MEIKKSTLENQDYQEVQLEIANIQSGLDEYQTNYDTEARRIHGLLTNATNDRAQIEEQLNGVQREIQRTRSAVAEDKSDFLRQYSQFLQNSDDDNYSQCYHTENGKSRPRIKKNAWSQYTDAHTLYSR
jgi:hypothetical protein